MEEVLWNEYEIHILPPDAIVDPPPYSNPTQDVGTQVSLINCNVSEEAGPSSQSPQVSEKLQSLSKQAANQHIDPQPQAPGSSEDTQDNPNSAVSARNDQNPTGSRGQEGSKPQYSYKYQSLSNFHSLPKIFLSIFQLLFGLTTIIRNPGKDLINKYGSSAFSLAIAPYVWMSFINLLANALCPQYPDLFLVRNSIMDEVEKRMTIEHKVKQTFFGVVGHLRRKGAGNKTTNDNSRTNAANGGKPSANNGGDTTAVNSCGLAIGNGGEHPSASGAGPSIDGGEPSILGSHCESPPVNSGVLIVRHKDKRREVNNDLPSGDNAGSVASGNDIINDNNQTVINGKRPAIIGSDGVDVPTLCRNYSVYYTSPNPGQLRRFMLRDGPGPDVAEDSVNCNIILQVPSCEDFETHERWETLHGKIAVIAR